MGKGGPGGAHAGGSGKIMMSGHPGWLRGRLRCVGLGLIVALTAPVLLAQADLEAAIAGLQRRYRSVDCLRAEFRQTYRAPGIEQIESGSMIIKKPGLMRWEYREPEVKLFIADGRETWLYSPADRQVLVRRFSAADLQSTPLQFLLGHGDIRRSFQVAWESGAPPAGGELRLKFTPRSAEADYAYAVVECDARSFDVRGIMIHERTGNTSEFVFTGLQTNVKVDDRQFQFKVPKGVETVRLDEK